MFDDKILEQYIKQPTKEFKSIFGFSFELPNNYELLAILDGKQILSALESDELRKKINENFNQAVDLSKSIVPDVWKLKIERNNIFLDSSANNFTEWDSLSNVRLTLKLEKEFNITISYSETAMMDDINDLFQLIKNKTLDKNLK